MRKTQMDNLKKVLVQSKANLLEKVKNNIDSNKNEANDEVRDSADIAADYYEREVAMGLSETERERLQEVEEALERIEDGTYGKCESCGGQISISRLEALPFARLCIECKAKEEQENKNGA